MGRIELRLLRSFVAIYERRSLSAGARHTACSQAAVSIHLKPQNEALLPLRSAPIYLMCRAGEARKHLTAMEQRIVEELGRGDSEA